MRLARSDDAGESFSAPIDIDSDGAYGQVGVVQQPGGGTVVSWWRRSPEGGMDLLVRAYGSGADDYRQLTVAHETVAQPVDVPQLVALEDGYLVAWTTFDDDGAVRVARLEL